MSCCVGSAASNFLLKSSTETRHECLSHPEMRGGKPMKETAREAFDFIVLDLTRPPNPGRSLEIFEISFWLSSLDVVTLPDQSLTAGFDSEVQIFLQIFWKKTRLRHTFLPFSVFEARVAAFGQVPFTTSSSYTTSFTHSPHSLQIGRIPTTSHDPLWYHSAHPQSQGLASKTESTRKRSTLGSLFLILLRSS